MRLLNNIGLILTGRGDYVRAAAPLQEALSISRTTGDRVREALTLNSLAVLSHVKGDLKSVEGLIVASLNIATELHDPVIQPRTVRARPPDR